MKNIDLSTTALLSTLRVSIWSGKKTEKSVEELVDQAFESKKAGSFVKKLILTEAMSKVTSIGTEARNTHNKMTLPWNDSGARLLPSSMYIKYAEVMREIEDRFEQATTEFLKNYDDNIKASKDKLGKLFKESDYPSKEEIESKFRMSISILPIESPDSIKVTTLGTYVDDIKQKIINEVQDNLEQATQSIWIRLRESVYYLGNRLSNPDNIFRESIVTNLRETIDLAIQLNITEDEDLANAIDYLKKTFYDIDVQGLRKDEHYRKSISDMALAVVPMIEEYA